MLNLTWLGAECATWGMPLLAEPIPGGWEAGPDMRTPEVLAAGARVSAEAGSDFVKTFATNDPTDFKVVADNCPVPVVVLGGAKTDDVRDLFQGVKAAVDNGAAGVAIGRNIWAHAQPDRIVFALAAILHENASVDEAVKEMG
jgi:DhnA family fructose-bisphosphate aldolase class Ia